MNRFARLIRSAKKPRTKTFNIQRSTFNVQYLTPQSGTRRRSDIRRWTLGVGRWMFP